MARVIDFLQGLPTKDLPVVFGVGGSVAAAILIGLAVAVARFLADRVSPRAGRPPKPRDL